MPTTVRQQAEHDAQLPEWATGAGPPAPDRRRASGGVALRALGPAAVAALLWWRGHSTAAVVLVAVAASVTVASLLRPAFSARLDDATRAFQRGAGRVLAVLLLGVVHLLVFTPIALVLRLAGKDPLAVGPPPADGSFWRPVPVSPGPPLHRRPFTYERAPSQQPVGRGRRVLRRIATGLGILVLLGAIDLGLGAAFDVVAGDDPEIRMELGAAAGRDAPWRRDVAQEELELEQRQVYDPYLGWRTGEFHGSYVNVSDGVRRSYEPAGAAAAGAVDVVFLGGSALLGSMQRDEHTIPSEFARLAEEDGIRVRASNRGADGYVNWQETLLLEQLVGAGSAPDLAVFYDGFNELAAQFQLGLHTSPSHLQADEFDDRLGIGRAGSASSAFRAAYEFWAANSAVHELAHAAHDALSSPRITWLSPGQQTGPPEPRGTYAAGLYARGVDIARGLAERHGFRTAFFWQPTLYSKRVAPGEEPLIGSMGTDPQAFRRAGAAARARLAPPVADLSGALDGVAEPVMYDPVHTNERGARAVAEAMYARLRPVLRELAGGGAR